MAMDLGVYDEGIGKIVNKIKAVYRDNFGSDDTGAVEGVLNDMIDLFDGRRNGFLKCDVKYHDFHHSLQTIPPFVDIIDGWNRSGNIPRIPKPYFDLGIIAVLLHDTGYIKTDDDVEGTGAKYTFTHIERSVDFAGQYLRQKGFDPHKVLSVQNAINCTGVSVTFEKLHFPSEEERIIGCALGTADLLGQMSAADYPEKLYALFNEFAEAYQYEGIDKLRQLNIKTFEDADDLLENTKSFYEEAVLERWKSMDSLYAYAAYPYRGSRNPYIEAIEKNIQKIESSIRKSSKIG